MKKFLIAVSCAALAFASCNTKGAAEGSAADSTATHAASSQVAYINIDTLVSKYDMYLDLRNDYEAKAKKADADLTSRGRSLEKDIVDFQNKVNKGLVTSITAAQMQQDLEKRQQSFMEQRNVVLNQMAEEEQVMLNQIHNGITEYLKEFNADLKYGMIISTSAGGPILNADPALDITADVLVGLNKSYVATKPAKPAKETK